MRAKFFMFLALLLLAVAGCDRQGVTGTRDCVQACVESFPRRSECWRRCVDVRAHCLGSGPCHLPVGACFHCRDKKGDPAEVCAVCCAGKAEREANLSPGEITTRCSVIPAH